MSDLIIPEPFASRIRELIEREHRSFEDILERMLESYPKRKSPPPPDIPVYEPRPAWSLTEDDIEIPDDIEDKQAYLEAARKIRPKIYAIAREYWQEVGDSERLALTDEQLDKVFWLIDHEGIPRFKSEKDSVVLPHDPLEDLIGLIDTDQTDLSMTVRETMRKKYGSVD